jgi:uncharacterized protein YndB with AHSA1/START domain
MSTNEPPPARPEPATEPDTDELASSHRLELASPPDEVWELLTDPDELARWLGRTDGFALEPGEEGRLTDLDGTERHLRVDDVRAGRSLRWTWWPAGPGPGDESGASVVEVTLRPSPAGTEVRVVESHPAASPIVASAGGGLGWSTRFVDLELRVLASRSLAARFAAR